jgi:hypothetical protein
MTTDRVRCMDCANWSPKRIGPGLAQLGFGHCAPFSAGSWQGFSGTYIRLCPKFTQAPKETIEARERFAAAQQPTEKAKP